MAEQVITQGFNGGAISVKKGDTLKLELPENPTTGYRWAVGPQDTKVLALTGDEYEGAGGAVGGGGLRIFRFSAKGSGRTSLQCRLSRSWQAGPARGLFSVHIDVK